MYELLTASGGDWTLLICLLAGSGLIGLSAGGAPGVGSLAGPVIAIGFTRFDKPQAVVTTLLILGQVRSLFLPQRSHIAWGIAAQALVPAFLGLIGGIAFWAWLNSLPDALAAQQVVKGLSGSVVILISLDILLARVLRLYKPPQLGRKTSIAVGFFGGVLSTVANVAGPLFAWYFQSRGLKKDALTATVAFFFLVLNLLKVPFYWWLGLYHDPAMLHSLQDWAIFAGLGGMAWLMWQVGAFWRARASERMFSAPICAAGLTVGTLILIQAVWR